MFFSKQKKRNLRINLFISSSHKRKRKEERKVFFILRVSIALNIFFSVEL